MSTNRSVPTDQLIEPGSSGLRVGHMTYLNSEVFYRHLPEESCELVAMPPLVMIPWRRTVSSLRSVSLCVFNAFNATMAAWRALMRRAVTS